MKRAPPQSKKNKHKTVLETSSLSHQLQKIQDQSANCFSTTSALQESRVRSAPISILSSAGSSSREAEQSMDVRTGSAHSFIQRSATTHTSLGPASRLDARNDTPKITKHQRTEQRIATTSLFYGRHKSRNRSTSLPLQISKSCNFSTSFNRGPFKSGIRLCLHKPHFHNCTGGGPQTVSEKASISPNKLKKEQSTLYSVSLELCQGYYK